MTLTLQPDPKHEWTPVHISMILQRPFVVAGHFRILSKDNALPLVAFSLTKTVSKAGKEEARQYTEFDLADKLRQRGWVLPAYTMAPDARQAAYQGLLLWL